jgi:hypothetical protein
MHKDLPTNYDSLAKASDNAVDAAHTMLEEAISVFVDARSAMDAPSQEDDEAFHAACEIADEVLRHVVAAYNAKMAAIDVWGQLHCEPAKQDNAQDSARNKGQSPPSSATTL